MKLYISGPIATEPDFVALFKKDELWLKSVGYETVNPVEVIACRDDRDEYIVPARCLETGQAAKPGDPHSWQCYMKYDIAAMMTCDGVAVQPDHWKSKGAALEIYLAMQVGMPVKPVRQWVSEAVRESFTHKGMVIPL